MHFYSRLEVRMPDNKNSGNSDTVHYIDSQGWVHSTPQAAIESSQQFESTSGQYVTGGNCPQDSSYVSNSSDTNSDSK